MKNSVQSIVIRVLGNFLKQSGILASQLNASDLYQSAVRSVPQAQSRMDRSGGEPLSDVCRFLVHPCRFLVHRWISRLWLNLTA